MFRQRQFILRRGYLCEQQLVKPAGIKKHKVIDFIRRCCRPLKFEKLCDGVVSILFAKRTADADLTLLQRPAPPGGLVACD